MALGRKTGGRKKGVRNKTTVALKEAILGSFEELGGTQYLVQLGRDNMTAYATLLGKVLPLQVSGEGGGPIKLEITWENGKDA